MICDIVNIIINVNFFFSNVAYHGELEKKAAMEQKRVMTGENGEPIPDGKYVYTYINPVAKLKCILNFVGKSLIKIWACQNYILHASSRHLW